MCYVTPEREQTLPINATCALANHSVIPIVACLGILGMSSDRDLEQSEAQIAAAKAELAAAKAELAATQADLAATQADLAVVQVELASVKTTSAQFAKLQDEENAQPMRRIKDLEDDIVSDVHRWQCGQS